VPLLAVVVVVVVVVVVDVVVVVLVVMVVVVLVVVVVPDAVVVEAVVVVVVVVVVDDDEALGQELGQKPYLSVTKFPPTSTSVEHQAEAWSTVAQEVYTIPLYLNGKTQALPVSGPDSVVQEGTVMDSS